MEKKKTKKRNGKTTQLSLIKFYPTEKRHIEPYKRVREGKPEIVSEHEKGVHVKPKLPKEVKERIVKGKAKKIPKKQMEELEEAIEDVTGEELEGITEDVIQEPELPKPEVFDPELYGITSAEIERKIIEENLVKSEAYKNWLKDESKLKELEQEYKTASESRQKELQSKIDKLRDDTNELYAIFRVIIDEEVISENRDWEKDFYNQLSEADRYNFKTIEQLKKEEETFKTEKNPFFDYFFENEKERNIAPVKIKLSETGEMVSLKWDNIGDNGFRKLNTYRDDYDDFISVVRDKYKGNWEKGSFYVNADTLDDILKDLETRNTNIKYYITGEHNTQADWEKHANIQKELVIEKESNNLILEVHGNRVILKSGAKNEKEEWEDKRTARFALNGAYSRIIKKKTGKQSYEACVVNEKGEYEIPIGLLSKAYWLLKNQYEFDVAVSDTRERNPISNPELRKLSLYSFQKRAVLDSLIEGQGLIVSPTGSGKTLMASGIISGFMEGADKYEEVTGRKVDVDSLFLVHRGTLMVQARKTFKETLPEDTNIGWLDAKNFEPSITEEDDINIGTIQGMYSALKKEQKGEILNEKDKDLLEILRGAELIFQDEAHHIIAESYDQVYDQNVSIHKFGLTATPSRKKQDDILRVMKIGDKRIPITYEEAQSRGILMKPNIVQIPIPESEEYRFLTRYGERGIKHWDKIIAQVENNDLRNDLIMDHAHRFDKANKKTIIFTRTKRHADALLKGLRKQYPDMNPVLLTGDLPREKQLINQDKLANGETNVAVGTDSLLGEGFDLPTLDCILGAGASQLYSKISVMQTAGRTMRVSEGKEQPIIIEYEDEPKSFWDRIQKRRKNYKEYNAFDYTEIEVPEEYHEHTPKGDKLSTKDGIQWVKQFTDPSEGTSAEKFQKSEYYQHKRKRGELEKELLESEVILSKSVKERKIPITERLIDLNKKQIYKIAKRQEVENLSKLKKKELINAITYHNWRWDDKDRAIARKVATGTETVKDVFTQAHKFAIKDETGKINPSEALEEFEVELEKKRIAM